MAPPARPAPDVPTSPCDACGQAFDERATACPRCGFPRGGGADDPRAPQPRGRAPRTAMWLSLAWPGAGHLYAGEARTGAILSLVAIAIVGLSAVLIGPVLGLLLWLGAALYAAIDSGRLVSESLDR